MRTCFFSAAAGKALTIVLAGLAAHLTSLPKTFRTPAFVAGFTRVLRRHKPGMLKAPVFFTSFAAISIKVFSSSELAFCFNPCSSANFLVIWPFVITLTLPFAFIGGNMALKNCKQWKKQLECLDG